MLTKAQIKRITSLEQKKFRYVHQSFVVEGRKSIEEFYNSNYKLETFFGIENTLALPDTHFQEVSERELKHISFLKTNTFGLAIFRIPKAISPDFNGLVGGPGYY